MSIELTNIGYTYMIKTPFEKTALSGVNLKVDEGDFLAIAGHTGSGKSTLIQIIAGLIKPTQGSVIVDDVDLDSKDKFTARRKIGIVFQYPEYQLFEETVEKDIAFGPRNLGLDDDKINNRVKESMKLVGLDYDKYKDMAPLDLSGGQKRRVAVAGILAMRPKYLILDEPTAGLDPKAREAMMKEIKTLHDKNNVTIIFVSHNMDDIARFANRVIVISQGKILIDDMPRKVFNHNNILKIAGLTSPSVTQLLTELRSNNIDVSADAIAIDECEKNILSWLKSEGR